MPSGPVALLVSRRLKVRHSAKVDVLDLLCAACLHIRYGLACEFRGS